ncbi:MAG: hypothetical protein R3179_03035 [Sedimenticolaceae bacterium]|nr:hypothetical protein [Sedimenticolaceae bacterium]
MIRPQFASLLLLISIILLLPACQSMAEQKRQDALNNTLKLYGNTMRWQGPENQAEFLKDPASMPTYRAVRIVSYDIVQQPTPVDENLVSQVARIAYVHTDTQVMRTIDDRQLWESNEEGTRWLRVNTPPSLSR